MRVLSEKVFPEEIEDGLTVYVDNAAQGADDFSSLLKKFRAFLSKCVKFGLRLNIGDTIFAAQHLAHLGFEITNRGYKPGASYTKAMAQMPRPTSHKELVSFLATANVFRYAVPNYNAITSSFSDLTPSSPFRWSRHHDEAFNTLKKYLSEPPLMAKFDPKLKTRVYTDYNGFLGDGVESKIRPALGCVIRQYHESTKKWRMVACYSRFLTVAETALVKKTSAFSSSVGEALAVIFGLQKAAPLLQQLNGFDLLCDSKNLSWLKTSTALAL
jgi:hypothetical protein